MRLIILLTLLTITSFVKSQNGNKSTPLIVDYYKDTVSSYKTGNVQLKITNNTGLPIIVSNRDQIYCKVVFCENDIIDSIVKADNFEKADIQYFSTEAFKIIDPKSSNVYTFTLYDGFFKKRGYYKVKYIVKLNRLNKCLIDDAESEWIRIYVDVIDFQRY